MVSETTRVEGSSNEAAMGREHQPPEAAAVRAAAVRQAVRAAAVRQAVREQQQ